MRWIDRFFDTTEKRVLWIYGIVCFSIIIISFSNFKLGITLEEFSDINSFFPLLEYSVVKETFLGRVILFGLDFTNRLSDYQIFFFEVIQLPQWGLLIGSFLLFTAPKKQELYKKLQLIVGVLLIVYLTQYMLIGWNLMSVLSTINVNLVVSNMQWIGTILKIMSFINLIVLLAASAKILYDYFYGEKI